MLRIGIAGCGRAARIHLDRLAGPGRGRDRRLRRPGSVGAEALALEIEPGRPVRGGLRPALHRSSRVAPAAGPRRAGIFSPHFWHYRLAMDALQAGCHVFIEKPLSTNVQEAADIVGLARGRSSRSGSAISTGFAPAWSKPAAGWPKGSHRAGAAGHGHPRPALADDPEGRRRAGGSTRRWPAAASSPTPATIWSTPCSGPPARRARRSAPSRARASRTRPGHGRRDPPGGRHPRHAGHLGRLARPLSSS